MENDDIKDDGYEVVLKARLPLSIDAVVKFSQTATSIFGEGLVILGEHADSREWLVIARPKLKD